MQSSGENVCAAFIRDAHDSTSLKVILRGIFFSALALSPIDAVSNWKFPSPAKSHGRPLSGRFSNLPLFKSLMRFSAIRSQTELMPKRSSLLMRAASPNRRTAFTSASYLPGAIGNTGLRSPGFPAGNKDNRQRRPLPPAPIQRVARWVNGSFPTRT